MSQPRNPHDKTFPKTVHLRISTIAQLEAMSGALDVSHGEIIQEALSDWFEKRGSAALSLARAALRNSTEQDAVRELLWKFSDLVSQLGDVNE